MKPVAKTWYETARMGDGITRIRETHIAPWLRCNIWHVQGRDRDLIIDTGMGLRPITAEVARLAERPLTAIVTHTHFDHAGGLHEFSHRCGHRIEAPIIAAPNAQNTVADIGYVTAEAFLALPWEGFRAEQYRVKPAALTDHLDEGDLIDLGDRVLRVLHLPGHSPGSIALWEEATGIFFSGDVLYDGELLDGLYHSDRGVFAQSLRRMRELPLRTIHAGHFRSFGRDDMQTLIDAYLAQGLSPDPSDD